MIWAGAMFSFDRLEFAEMSVKEAMFVLRSIDVSDCKVWIRADRIDVNITAKITRSTLNMLGNAITAMLASVSGLHL